IVEALGKPTVLTLDAATGSYRSASGDSLRYEGDTAILVQPDGTREVLDSQGRLLERDEGSGNKVALAYNDLGHLERIEGPGGAVLQISTDESGRIVEAKSPAGDSVRYLYATKEKETAEPQKNTFEIASYGYNDAGALTRIEHPRRGATELSYDARGRVRERKWSDG